VQEYSQEQIQKLEELMGGQENLVNHFNLNFREYTYAVG
jgi:hypothetical protein